MKTFNPLKGLVIYLTLIIGMIISLSNQVNAQTSTEFWLAPPEVTSGHSTGGDPTYLRLATGDAAATVTIDMPANGTFVPINVVMAANSSHSENMTAYLAMLETAPTGTVVNTGLRIVATSEITAYYEVSSPQNPDIWALKGLNGLGTEFYTPFQTIWANGLYNPVARTSFDIVATEDNTTVLIYPTKPLDGGQPAFQSFSIILNQGQTYSASVTSSSLTDNPAGSMVLSDKPIAVSVKDDSVNPSGAGCRDLMGDQLVPVEIVGKEYIVQRGGLTIPSTNEKAYAVATENNTQISVGGVVQTTLFNGQTYVVDLATDLTYITANKPFYLVHVSGFGCEAGMALLPPLNCAGSEKVNFVRSTAETFFINLLVRNGSQDAFALNGNTTIIDPLDFTIVPGTDSEWVGAQIAFTTEITAGVAQEITNSEDVFSMGLINGGGSSGCRYGYFSEFSAEIIVNAGPNQIVCANRITQLDGSVTGGATAGIWTSNGSGAFVPDEFTIDAIYEPSLADLSAGLVTLTLTSMSNCFPVEDAVQITYTPAPVVEAGDDIVSCGNQNTVQLDGFVDVASGGIWSGGAGSFSGGTGNLDAVYTPTTAEKDSGSLILTLTSTGNGNCFAEFDEVEITFGPSPTADAGDDFSVCENNPAVILDAAVTIAAGGVWSGGTGNFNPSPSALGATYTPSATEIFNGGVTLTLTTTDNGGCVPVTDNVYIEIYDGPVVFAGNDQTLCKNNPNVNLAGSVSNADGGTWSGGSGSYSTDENDLTVVYTPVLAEILSGSLTLTLTSTGNGDCTANSDQVTITFTNPPVVDAGDDDEVCSNNAEIQLNGSLSGATLGIWTGGSGSYSPNNTTLGAAYTPTTTEISNGSVTLTLTSLDNGNCLPVSDDVEFTFSPSPTVDAGDSQSICENNPVISLSGTKTIAGGVAWSGGNGTFLPSINALNATYTPTATEIANGTLVLTLTTINNGDCNAVSDNTTITFTDAPTADAGNNFSVCSNNAAIALDGGVTVVTTGSWSGGLGTFTPDNNDLNAVYTPTATEINSGSITLTLTTTGNGNCTAVTDQVTISFTAAPTADAGDNISVCSNNAEVDLDGSVTITTTGQWSGGAGGFTPSVNALNATYAPTATEISSGSVTLTLTTTNNLNCNAVSDNVNINFTPSPTANAGNNSSVCENDPEITLNGSVTLASGGTWSGGSGSYDPVNTNLGAVYTPSAGEISAGTVTLTLTTSGNGNCNSVSDAVVFTITDAPVVNAGIGSEYCSNNSLIQLGGTVNNANSGTWSGGSGTFTPNALALNATYQPSQGEINSGTLTLTLTSTGNGQCVAVTDDVTYTFGPSPTADAGDNQSVCTNNAVITLDGSVTLATGGTWSGGAGNFTPNANALTGTYTPTVAEIASGSVTLTLTTTGNDDCSAVSDEVIISFTPSPTANASNDRTVCANDVDVNLNGSVTLASGGIWTGGNGTFTPINTSLGATYTPSATEIAAGTVSLTLTTTGNANCNAVSDQMVITIDPSPIVDAGDNAEYCANNPSIALDGSVLNADGASWSGGNGTFTPGSNDVNAVYTPSQGEINNGFVTLTLTSTGNGDCIAVSDNVTFNFTPAPTADANDNQILCANNAQVQLDGAITIATGATWSGGSGSFLPSANSLTAVYTPTATEISNGSVTLTLTTTGNDDCVAVSDNMLVTFTPAPVVDAGDDLESCANDAEVELDGFVSIATGGTWSGGSGEFSPNNTTLNADYTPSTAEINAGTVTLTLTSTGNGNCLEVTDQVTITIAPAPVVDANDDQSICSNNTEVQLNGSVLNADGGQWSGGLGIYDTDNTTLNATYTPTLGEVLSGSVNLTLTSTGNGTCMAVTDQMTITFTETPTMDAGDDVTVCANAAQASVEAEFTVANGVQWSGGNGNYSPNILSPAITYTPTAAEIAAGTVTLTATTTGFGNCVAVTDQVVITIEPQPSVNAGQNFTSCANNPNVELNGSYSNAAGVQWSGGTGFFNPNNQTEDATYVPSSNEIAAGSVNLTLTTTGNGSCVAVSDVMTIFINPSPVVDAGDDINVCENNPVVNLSGDVDFANGGTWTGGAGSFNPSPSNLSAIYTPTDTEISNGFVNLTLTSTGNGDCNAVTDVVTIFFTPSPVADAGSDLTACENNPEVQLDGSFSVAEGAIWSGGVGSFDPGNSSPGATYTPTANEIANGMVTLTLTTFGNGNCLPASDQVEITFTPQPVVTAGEDYYACVDNLIIPLEGDVTGATFTGTWTTNGTGVFVPNQNTLSASYIASSQDSLAGLVTLTLTSTNNGTCLPESDEIDIYILPAGTANANTDQTVCANNAGVTLNGSIGGAASSGVWSTSGTGVFTPSANVLNATYIPGDEDIDAGTVTLSLTANSCNQATNEMVVTITPAPEVVAGDDLTTCSSELNVELDGYVTGASSTGVWTSSGTGTFSPSASALNATYNASAADAIAEVITLTLTSTNIGNCVPVSDQLTLNIFPSAIANAGNNQSVCSNNAIVEISGSFTGGADEGIWSTSGTGTFEPSANDLTATYIPSDGDIVNGSVNLILSAINSCNNATDFITVTFTPAPVVEAGDDYQSCGDVFPFALIGTVENAGGGEWTTSGSGTFANSNSLSTTYTASEEDVENGGVYLYLTSTDNGNCLSEMDSLFINISSGVVVNAGPDRQACIAADVVQLFGSVSNGSSTGTWTTTGNGTFAPNADALNAIYDFTQDDIDAGSITFTLTSTNNGICSVEEDSLVLTFGNATLVVAGENTSMCTTENDYQLSGVVDGGTTTGVWTTSGTGTFEPDSAALDALYVPSEEDINQGSVSITLTSTNNTVCDEASNSFVLNFRTPPVVTAGADVTLCGTSSDVQLLGNVTGATGAIWNTSGTGVFLPSDSLTTAIYSPSTADSLAGSITLTLTSYGSGACGTVQDELTITFAGLLEANAGNDMIICEDDVDLQLGGSVEGTTTGVWSTNGTGSFTPDASDLNAIYTLGENDVDIEELQLILTTTDNGECEAKTDTMHITINAVPLVIAGDDVEVCITDTDVQLNASIENTASAQWNTSGSGSFTPDANALDAVYLPSASDVNNGSVTLTLTTAANGMCAATSDEVLVTFLEPATVDAGDDIVVCSTESEITLDGSVTGITTSGIWSTNGFGTFLPSAEDPDAVYVPGSNDILVGSVQLTLSSNGNGPCQVVSNVVQVTINPAPSVNVGDDQFVCESAGEVLLNAQTDNTVEINWTTTGDGVFLPNAQDPLASYIIGAQDAENGEVTIIAEAQALEACVGTSDTLFVTINNPLSVAFDAGTACAGDPIQFTDATTVLAGNITSWTWDFGNGNISNQQNPQVLFTETGSYNVKLTVQSSIGCSDTTMQLVNVLESPQAVFTISDNPAPINFDVEFTDISNGAESWSWTFGDNVGTSIDQNSSYSYETEGLYTVSLVVTGAGGCIDSVAQTLQIEGRLMLPPRLPNSFTPNGDGMNDVYFVRGGPFAEMQFEVYDNWGRVIFKTSDQNVGWDGTEDGKQSAAGVYVYTVNAITDDGVAHSLTGKITLIR